MSLWYCKCRDVLTGPMARCAECSRVESVDLPPLPATSVVFTDPPRVPPWPRQHPGRPTAMSETQTLDVASELPPFEEFTKIARLSRDCVVTEKIDGTNAQVCVLEDGRVLAGSRNRWITPDADNFGFARWVAEHTDELRDGLGVGRHYGEWWGAGVQRRYGLDHKRFSLFNTARWVQHNPDGGPLAEKQQFAPACCHVVPILYAGVFDTARIAGTLTLLGAGGSVAAPGFMDPEGVVVWHEAARTLFKKTLHKDEAPKSSQRALPTGGTDQ